MDAGPEVRFRGDYDGSQGLARMVTTCAGVCGGWKVEAAEMGIPGDSSHSTVLAVRAGTRGEVWDGSKVAARERGIRAALPVERITL
jgi:hypothetical protein